MPVFFVDVDEQKDSYSLFAQEILGNPQILPNVDAQLSGKNLTIMLARTHAEKTKGLMFFENLPNNHGMLFIYNYSHFMSFWMLNTKIPLDIIFFSENLRVVDWIENMQPGYGKPIDSMPSYKSRLQAQYALEMKSGSISEMDLKLNDTLSIPLTALYSE